jgi:hypothetical protein
MLKILQIVDQLILSQTGKHLNSIEKAIIEGTWQGKTYTKIADKYQYSESRVRDIGYQLWRILSKKLGEDINKLNFRSTMERLELMLPENTHLFVNKNNIFSSYIQSLINENEETFTLGYSRYLNLKQAPQIVNCHGRENELSIMVKCLKKYQQMVVFILGSAGIGKSTLVRSFIDLQALPVDVIIWKNLQLFDSFDSVIYEILTDTKNLYNHSGPNNHVFERLLDLLIAKRCLFILDNLEEIFQPQKLIGQYKSEYQGYQRFLKIITEVKHQSQFILISQKKCPEMQCFQPNLYPIRCLELTGVKDTKILENLQLKNKNFFPDLINLYEGNPRYLQDIAILIRDIFDGDVGKFLAENSLIITENMASHFQQLFSQLSSTEQQIVLALTKNSQPCSKGELIQYLNVASIELTKGLHSLQRRYLVNTISGEQTLFQLSTVFQEYLKGFIYILPEYLI